MRESKMRLQNLVPVLDVRDVDESIKFYQSALGFSVHERVEWGGRTEWALMRSGQVQIMLCASQEELGEEDFIGSDNVFFVYLEDMDALTMQLRDSNSKNVEYPADTNQNRDFYLRDPDGYVLWFSQRPLGESSTGQTYQGSSPVFA